MAEDKFDVHQFFEDDYNEHVLSRASAQEAIKKAHFLATSVGARIGTTKRVIITDSGDFTAWEWVHGKGFVFPLICNNPKCTANDVLADTPCKACGTITGPKELPILDTEKLRDLQEDLLKPLGS